VKSHIRLILLALSFLSASAYAQSDSSLPDSSAPDRQGKRPKFSSKSVIASKLKGDRWVDESKLPNEVLCDYVRVYQHPKYREAEAALRAASLVRPPKPKATKLGEKKPASNEELENLN